MTKKSKLPSFDGYKPVPMTPQAYPNYFNPETQVLTPVSKVKLGKGQTHEVSEVLNSLTLALEAGVVSKEKWVKEVFGTTKAFEKFLEEFEYFGEWNRIWDRWWTALSVLGDTVYDEQGFTTSTEIAERLRYVAVDSNQM